ncbi:hypothetical protein D9615_004344 [Tricholomella constricta]|uniref:4-hydroxybenzoate polyprenyltransferase, mitochondrial n=1 Tax=Tricholomella constricta TaxID=117010 RepID=A0A8H5HEP7_9AGAR|nr:hypothetical protein D9615_004344 [Tricholomella constricta]
MSSSLAGENQTLVAGKVYVPAQPSSFSFQAYWQLARMHEFPAGSILIFWPAAWGYLLGAHAAKPGHIQLASTLAGLFVWSTLLHSAGCVLNDICDVDFDRQVERTKKRPLAAGRVSLFGAWVFFLIQMVALVAMLTFVNHNALISGAFGIFPLATLYPLMKRITWWPQAWLGLAMNWTLPTAWLIASPNDYKSSPMWVLTFGTLCWTIFYDTIYACQDRKDDMKAGVKSTALLFGSYVKEILSVFGAMFVITLAYAGQAVQLGPEFFVISVGGCTVHLIWQLVTLDVEIPKNCGRRFVANGDLGYIIVTGMLVDWYLH